MGAGGDSVRAGGQEDTQVLQGVPLPVPSIKLTVRFIQTLQSADILLGVAVIMSPCRKSSTSVTPRLTPSSLSGLAEQARSWLHTQETGPLIASG